MYSLIPTLDKFIFLDKKYKKFLNAKNENDSRNNLVRFNIYYENSNDSLLKLFIKRYSSFAYQRIKIFS